MKSINNDNIPLKEYPRPLLRRESFYCLNGFWDYSFSKNEDFVDTFEGKILVPYSPEARLSHVSRQLKKDEVLHYRRFLTIDRSFNKGRVLLYIGAVDQRVQIYINHHLAAQWVYGYLPIEVDITKFLKFDGQDEIYLKVRDDADSPIFARGKQTYKRGGIWYTAISGIWNSVFIESVPDNYVKNICLVPDFDHSSIDFDLDVVGDIKRFDITIYFKGKKVSSFHSEQSKFSKNLSSFYPWSVENPNLYDVEISYKKDKIFSYFGMRKFSTCFINGRRFFTLNNKPILLKGILDQGYFIDGIYTVSKDEDYVNDILAMKNLGFNMLRKHIKIESQRFYYHCDRLGMIVWQDIVSGGNPYSKLYTMIRPFLGFKYDDTDYRKLGRKYASSRNQFRKEVELTIKYLKGVTSIGLWTIFNEGWGQFDAVKMTNLVKSIDSTRPIDSTSGWYDQGCGDCFSKHVYFRPISLKNDHKRCLVLSEFGGYSLHIDSHCFSKKAFGYKKMLSKDELMASLSSLFKTQVIPNIVNNGLSAFVYTQLSDVEDEVNGLLTYDRKIQKVETNEFKQLLDEAELAFNKKYH